MTDDQARIESAANTYKHDIGKPGGALYRADDHFKAGVQWRITNQSPAVMEMYTVLLALADLFDVDMAHKAIAEFEKEKADR